MAAQPHVARVRGNLTRRLPWILLAVVLVAAWVVGASLLLPTDVPDDLELPELDPADYFSASFLAKAADYERFSRVNALLSAIVLLAVLAVYARHGARFARESAAGRIGTGMFLAMVGLAFVWLAQFPFGLAQLWWERRHDISKEGYLDWIVTSWLGLGGVFVSISIAVLITMALAGVFRTHWWLPAAPAFVAIALLVAFIGPFLIPDLHPVRNERVKAEARSLERAQDLPRIRVDVQRVHKDTTAPNAEAAGLGPTRRVILWDTLLDGRFDGAQVRSVLAHELGHHSRHHLWKSIGWYALFALPGAFIVALVTRRRGGLHQPAAVPLALFVVVGLQVVSLPVQSIVTRRYEAEADWVALQTTRDPTSARSLERKLAETTLTQPRPPGWAHALLDNHPTIMQRIAMAEAWEKRRARSPREVGDGQPGRRTR